MIDCLIAFKNISLITWRQQAERDIFYEAQRVLSIATQDGVVSKFLLKNNLATFATSDKKWNTLAIVAEGPIFAIYCSYCTQIYSEYGLHFTRTYAKVVNISSFIEWYLMNNFFLNHSFTTILINIIIFYSNQNKPLIS